MHLLIVIMNSMHREANSWELIHLYKLTCYLAIYTPTILILIFHARRSSCNLHWNAKQYVRMATHRRRNIHKLIFIPLHIHQRTYIHLILWDFITMYKVNTWNRLLGLEYDTVNKHCISSNNCPPSEFSENSINIFNYFRTHKLKTAQFNLYKNF